MLLNYIINFLKYYVINIYIYYMHIMFNISNNILMIAFIYII